MSRPGASWSSRVRRGCGDAHVARRVCPVTALGPPSPRPPYCASGKASTEAPRPLLSRRGTPLVFTFKDNMTFQFSQKVYFLKKSPTDGEEIH